MNKTIISCFTFLLFISSSVIGQEAVVHTDKSYYVTGEVIWYKAYMPSSFDVEASVKVEISDPTGKSIDSHFHTVTGMNVIGHYSIPFGLTSGNYTFSLAVMDKTSMVQKVMTQFIVPIYNDLEKLAPQNVTDKNGNIASSAEQITLKFDKQGYNPGDDVRLGIVSDVKLLDYSISVVDADLLGEYIESTSIQNQAFQSSDVDLQNLTQGVYVKGRAKNENGKGQRMNQLGVFDGKAGEMHIVRTDNEGYFTLTLPEIKGSRDYQFAGYISNESQNLNFELTSNISPSATTPITYNAAVENYIKESITRKKIHQYYNVLEYDLAQAQTKIEKNEIKPDKTYDFKDYVKFETVGEFFNEIISAPLKFEINGEEIKANMYDAEGFKRFNQLGTKTNFIFAPVFIVNGKLTRDGAFIYKIPFSEVSHVDFYLQRKSLAKYLGNFRNYGIAVVHIKNPNFTVPVKDQENIKRVNGIQQEADFSTMKSFSIDMPQLRPVVYWNPSINDGSGINSPLTFKATDDVSTFKVKVVARTENGNIIRGSGTYSTSKSEN